MSAAAPELTRLVLVADGCVKANFSDNSILILSASGNAFVSVQSDGQRQRQLSEFALHRHVAALAVVLEFRNMHADQPCYCERVARANPREGLRLGFRMGELWWSATAEEAIAKGLVQRLEVGKVALSTEDSAGRIVLHQNRRFAICYPLLVQEHPQQGSYEYVWQTQVFSLLSYPPRWQAAVSVAVQAAEHLQSMNDQDIPSGRQVLDQNTQVQAHTTQDQSSALVHKAGSSGSSAAARTELPAASRRSPGSGVQDRCPTDGWWTEQTLTMLPDTEVVLLEWNPEATYQFHPDIREVEAWVHLDESCLATSRQGRFISHCRTPAQHDQGQGQVTEQLFTAECVPETAWCEKAQGGRYALAPLAAHAIKVRHQMSAVATRLASCQGTASECVPTSTVTGQPMWPKDIPSASESQPLGLLASQIEETFAVVSEEVIEESLLPGHGTFTAYSDGRLRANFEDRTFLHMNAARTHCKVVLPDGELVLVAVSQPVGVEVYVEAALRFLEWAMKPYHVRHEEAHAQAVVRAELNSLQRMNTILHWTTGKTASQLSLLNESAKDMASHQDAGVPAFSPQDVYAMLQQNQDLLNRL